jgi:hypothetical protein
MHVGRHAAQRIISSLVTQRAAAPQLSGARGLWLRHISSVNVHFLSHLAGTRSPFALHESVRWSSSTPAPSSKLSKGKVDAGKISVSADETSVTPTPGKLAPQSEIDSPGAIGGFMRGLIGGRDVAAEDSFVAEAKEQGIDVPPPPPLKSRSDLVMVKRRKRREESGESEESIRDRLFSRFGGSAFMRGAFEAKDRIADSIDESDNPIINMFRNVYDRFFAENEMAMVVREIREGHPSFTVSEFLREVETVTIPQVLSAYLAGNRSKLEPFCTEDALRMLNASILEREVQGIIMDTNVLGAY